MPDVGRIVSVAGGQGVVAGNLAVAIAQGGARVALVDADPGAATPHTRFAASGPSPARPLRAPPASGSSPPSTGAPGDRPAPIENLGISRGLRCVRVTSAEAAP